MEKTTASPTDFNKDFNDYIQKMTDAARHIADLYLERFPRECIYGVNLSSSEDNSELTYYRYFTSEELDILRKSSQIAQEEDCTLEEILSDGGYTELLGKLLEHHTYMELNILDSVDLDHPLKFTRVLFQTIDFKSERNMGAPYQLGAPLTDEEFKELMTALLIRSNHYSMNIMVYDKPTIAQHIMHHLAHVSTDTLLESYTPFVFELSELKDCVDSILNPFRDALGLFGSDDETLRDFVLNNQIVPESVTLYSSYNDDDAYHVFVHFRGTNVSISQKGSTSDGRFHDTDEFQVAAATIMQRFSIEQPEGIFPFLREHYNTRDSFARLRSEFKDK